MQDHRGMHGWRKSQAVLGYVRFAATPNPYLPFTIPKFQAFCITLVAIKGKQGGYKSVSVSSSHKKWGIYVPCLPYMDPHGFNRRSRKKCSSCTPEKRIYFYLASIGFFWKLKTQKKLKWSEDINISLCKILESLRVMIVILDELFLNRSHYLFSNHPWSCVTWRSLVSHRLKNVRFS